MQKESLQQSQTIHYSQIKNQIQQLIPNLGKKRRYQTLLIIFMCTLQIVMSYTFMLSSFVLMNPIFECNNQLTTQQQACKILDQCKITNNFTAVYYSQIYCDQQYTRSALQSIPFIGYIITMFLVSYVSDLKGRRFTLISVMIVEILGISLIILGVYMKIAFIIGIGMFLTGVFMATTDTVNYIILFEFMDSRVKQKAITYLCSSWGLAQVTFLPIYYFIPQWYNYLILLILLPTIGLFLIALFFIIQAPLFHLYHRKDLQNFGKCIQQILMYNEVDQQKLTKIRQKSKKYIQYSTKNNQKKTSVKQVLMRLINNRQVLVVCICIAIIRFGFNLYYCSIQGTMQRTGYNFGVSLFFVGIHQFIGYMLISFVTHKLQRKKALFVTIVISSVIGLSLVSSFVRNNFIFQTIIISTSRLCTIVTYSFMQLLVIEYFSAEMISVAYSFQAGFAYIGIIIIPYIIVKMNDFNIHPAIFSSCVYLVLGLVPLLFLKQTLKKNKNKDEISSNSNEKIGNEQKQETSMKQFLLETQQQTKAQPSKTQIQNKIN